MTSRHQDDSSYADLVAAWADLHGLATRHAAEREAARSEGADDVTRALAAERAAKDKADAVSQTAGRVARHARGLAASASVTAGTEAAAALPTVGACEGQLTAVASDLASAESAWKWVERTRRANATVAATSTPAPAPPRPATEPERATGLDRRLTYAAIFVVALCLLLAAVIFLL